MLVIGLGSWTRISNADRKRAVANELQRLFGDPGVVALVIVQLRTWLHDRQEQAVRIDLRGQVERSRLLKQIPQTRRFRVSCVQLPRHSEIKVGEPASPGWLRFIMRFPGGCDSVERIGQIDLWMLRENAAAVLVRLAP